LRCEDRSGERFSEQGRRDPRDLRPPRPRNLQNLPGAHLYRVPGNLARRDTARRSAVVRSAGGAPLARPHAVEGVAQLPPFVLLDEAVDVGIETRELLVEVSRELQELHDDAIEALTRDEERNPRWIRRQQDAGHASLELIDFDAVNLAMRDASDRIGGLHRRL